MSMIENIRNPVFVRAMKQQVDVSEMSLKKIDEFTLEELKEFYVLQVDHSRELTKTILKVGLELNEL